MEKDIIIEFGHEYIRIGVVNDKTPRKTIKTNNLFKSSAALGGAAFEMKLEECLYNIFFSHLNSPSQGRTVVLLEKVYTDRRIIETACKILFKKLNIQKVQLALSCVTPLYLTGRYSGLVISAGASAVEVMPVYEGFPIFSAFVSLPLGTQSLNRLIRDELTLLNKQLSLDALKHISDQEINQHIKNQYCSLNPSSNPVTIPLKHKLRVKWIPDRVNFSSFYGNPDHQEHNIAYTFLKVLASVPEKCLEAVSSNIVLAGGLWRVKGMQKYFKGQVQQHYEKFPKLVNLNARKMMGFVSWSFNPSEVSWIGCSIAASIHNIDYLSLDRKEYGEHGFTEKIMSTYFLSG